MNIDKVKQKLIQEKELSIKASIYHYSQVLFSYNSNKIEGRNHFKLFDYILDKINEDLTKEMLIEMHKILKRNTTQEKCK